MIRHNADIPSTRRRNPHRSTRDMNSNKPETGTQRHRCQFRYPVTSLAPIIQFLSILIPRPFDNTFQNTATKISHLEITKFLSLNHHHHQNQHQHHEPLTSSWSSGRPWFYHVPAGPHISGCPLGGYSNASIAIHERLSSGRISAIILSTLYYFIIYVSTYHNSMHITSDANVTKIKQYHSRS